MIMANYLISIDLFGFRSSDKIEQLNIKMEQSDFMKEYLSCFYMGNTIYVLPTCKYVMCNTKFSLNYVMDLAFNIAFSVSGCNNKPVVMVVEFDELNTKYLPILAIK